jgi:hypothetical protein
MAVGLVFTTSVATGPTNSLGDPNARTFFAGVAAKGPLGAQRVTSLATYVTAYGGRVSYSASLYDAVQTYFAEGGAELFISRVVGTAAAVGTLTLVDRTTGTPLPTVKIEAKNPGDWASSISVATASGAVSGVTLTVLDGGVVVETYPNETDVAQLIADINARSTYVTASNLHSTGVGTVALPAIRAAQPLASGTDDRATVTPAKVIAGFDAFGSDLGPGAVAAPGYTADLVGSGLITHCVANNRIALLSGPLGGVLTDMQALAAGVQSAAPLYGDYAGIFGPWVLIPDGSSTRAIDPVSYVAGVRARAINAEGFQKSPAGTISNARFVLGTASALDGAVNNAWNAAQVNGITVYRGNTRLYGWRSLSKDFLNFPDLTGRSIANAVQDLVEQAADPFVFDTIDGTGVLYGQLSGAIVGYLSEAADHNAFFPLVDSDGVPIDPGYTVEINSSSDVISQYGANTILVTVGFRPSPTADLVLVNIVLAGLGVSI